MSRTAYHHGALRMELLRTGLELARQGGPAAVILREAARQLQVSPTAAYRHFADKQALLLGVRREALGLLGQQMLDTAAHTAEAGSPLLHFRALGQGYVEFALAEPGLFRTLAAPGVVVQPGQAPEGRDPFALLAADLDALAATGLLPAARRPRADAVAWAAVHGLAVLLLDGLLDRDDAAALTSCTLDAVAFGLLAPARAEPRQGDDEGDPATATPARHTVDSRVP